MTRVPAVLALLIIGFWGSACTDEDMTVAERHTPGDEGRALIADEMSPGTTDVCRLLPPDDGACSVACDWEALREFVPVGTCAAFVCDLVDGSQAIFHACHPQK
jgi:hypothetical protein